MPMIVNTAWLLEYLEPRCSHEELVEALPRLGLEIERQHALKTALEPVRVGFVREKATLPGASGMYLCAVEIGRGRTIPVVCASEHEVQVGWGVPVAEAGTVLPTGRSIKADQFHGVRSLGMICLDGEMGLIARGSGMQHFDDESALGRPLPSLAEIPEYLLELNVLPNRPDFLGLVGIAREVAALLRLNLRYPETELPPADGPPQVSVAIEEPELCTRYLGAVLRGVKVGPSPAWLKARLLLAGLRPISNVVDITNYVMVEWGQPLHAFDFRTIAGGKIVVRKMAPGESLELLTGKVVEPGEVPPLVIADADRPVALAGIMGGGPTQTTSRTAEILLEAAHFDPVNIRKTAQRIDLGTDRRGTDSSHRFERGTDPNRMLEGAFRRAARLIAEVAGGTLDGPPVDRHPNPRSPRMFRLGPSRVGSYLGTPIDAGTIRDALTRLSMDVSADGDPVSVAVPTWRADANDPVVLIEDVARMVGYDAIPVAPRPSRPTLGRRAAGDRVRQSVSDRLAASGYFECRNPSMESPRDSLWLGAPGPSIALRNWATQEMSVLRRSLLPGLFAVVRTNVARGADSVRFFEVDRVFGTRADEPGEGGAMQGRWRVAGVAGGRLGRSDWRDDAARVDFHTLKGTVEDLLEGLGVRGHAFRPADRLPFALGAALEVVAEGERPSGLLGEIDPEAAGFDRLSFPLFAFEIDLEPLEASYSALPAHRATSRQPAVTRDLAIVVPDSALYEDLLATIRAHAGPRLESIRLVDRYKGPQVPQGRQSLAFHLVFRDPSQTLTAEEVAETMTGALDALRARFEAELRG